MILSNWLICGRSAAGKTTAANVFASLNYHVVSAGDFFRSLVRDKTKAKSKLELLNLGAEFMTNYGSGELTQQLYLKTLSNKPNVVEGVRPLQTLLELKELLNAQVIYIDASEESRVKRLTERDHLSTQELEVELSHPLEKSVDTLSSHADHIIHNNGNLQLFEHNIRQLILGNKNDQ